jgi:hypothetical protein
MSPQAKPSVSRCRLAIAQIVEGKPGVTKDALDRGKARRSRAGADCELD